MNTPKNSNNFAKKLQNFDVNPRVFKSTVDSNTTGAVTTPIANIRETKMVKAEHFDLAVKTVKLAAAKLETERKEKEVAQLKLNKSMAKLKETREELLKLKIACKNDDYTEQVKFLTDFGKLCSEKDPVDYKNYEKEIEDFEKELNSGDIYDQ